MFIDYVSLMLINMIAGLFLLAYFVYEGLNAENQKKWAPGFAVTGLVALLNGLHMTWTWPLPGSYNSLFGNMSVLFGFIFLGAALALAKDWNLHTVAIYAFFAGLAACISGASIINLGLTKAPLLAGIGFILTGLGGVLAAPTLYLKPGRGFRLLGAIVLLIAALIWASIAYLECWEQPAAFKNWVPTPMRNLMPTEKK